MLGEESLTLYLKRQRSNRDTRTPNNRPRHNSLIVLVAFELGRCAPMRCFAHSEVTRSSLKIGIREDCFLYYIVMDLKITNRETRQYGEPFEATCECGALLVLTSDMANECFSCHRWYNSVGQSLKPPDQWFDEDGRTPDTGETRADLFGPQQPFNF
jgi:hypothetical protein